MKNLNLLLPLIIAAFLIYSCTPDPKLIPPVLTSAQVTQITYTTATAGGELTDIGGAYITAKGVCWSTSVEPTIDNNKTTESGGLGVFTSQLTGLTPNTTYYVRAYGTNSAGTAYGNEVSFKTLQLEVPVLTTTEITLITNTTASSGGNITDDKGGSVTARGVCWGIVTNPTITDSKTIDSTGTGTFTSSITALIAGTVYYVRAYATNSAGTAYGNEITFTTLATVPGAPTIGTASAGNAQATITFTAPVSNGGSAITGYTVTSVPGGLTATGTASPITVTGLTNGTAYTFTVTATNAIGISVASSASNSVTPVAPSTVPGAPTIGTASAGNAQATVTFTVPVSNGGSVIISYTVTSSPGNITGTGTASPITVTGLTNETAYTFTVTATNAIGNSAASSASNSVTPLSPITDIDGNVYNIVTIGTQVWMAENLKTTKYNDVTAIPLVTDGSAWAALSTPAYCWYNNDAATYKATYGALYNWYTVNTGKLCPTGWHVPTDVEWTTLITFLGGDNVAWGKLLETGTAHWIGPNTGPTNESGFTALPGGIRAFYDNGAFYSIGTYGYWWSATEFDATYPWGRGVAYDRIVVDRTNDNTKQFGFSVRCVRDL